MVKRRCWTVAASLLLMVCAGRDLAAQQPGYTGPQAGASAGFAGPGVGGPGGPGTAFNQFPPTYAPWPTISPYDNRFEQHMNVNGTWITETNNEPNRYYFTLESLVSRVKKPEETLVGSLGVDPLPGEVFPIVDLGAFTAGSVGSTNVIPLAVGQQQEHDPTSPGIRGVWGLTNPDGSGFELSGYWSSDVSFLFQRGFDGATEADPSSLRITAAVPLDDGFGGSSVPYDKFFRITHDTETFEAQLTNILTHKIQFKFIKLQPEWGLRYMFIRERFFFDGADSGLALTFFPDGLPDTSVPPVAVVDPYYSSLRSRVNSHLAGPQIGMRYELGGDIIRIWGASRFGLFANREHIHVDGFGIGDGFGANFVQDSPFSDKQIHTHVSPMFEHAINADFKVFGVIPVFRRIYFLEQAKLRVGYSITSVLEVARPGSSIVWQGLPRYPRVRVDRENWYLRSWHFGIHWEY